MSSMYSAYQHPSTLQVTSMVSKILLTWANSANVNFAVSEYIKRLVSNQSALANAIQSKLSRYGMQPLSEQDAVALSNQFANEFFQIASSNATNQNGGMFNNFGYGNNNNGWQSGWSGNQPSAWNGGWTNNRPVQPMYGYGVQQPVSNGSDFNPSAIYGAGPASTASQNQPIPAEKYNRGMFDNNTQDKQKDQLIADLKAQLAKQNMQDKKAEVQQFEKLYDNKPYDLKIEEDEQNLTPIPEPRDKDKTDILGDNELIKTRKLDANVVSYYEYGELDNPVKSLMVVEPTPVTGKDELLTIIDRKYNPVGVNLYSGMYAHVFKYKQIHFLPIAYGVAKAKITNLLNEYVRAIKDKSIADAVKLFTVHLNGMPAVLQRFMADYILSRFFRAASASLLEYTTNNGCNIMNLQIKSLKTIESFVSNTEESAYWHDKYNGAYTKAINSCFKHAFGSLLHTGLILDPTDPDNFRMIANNTVLPIVYEGVPMKVLNVDELLTNKDDKALSMIGSITALVTNETFVYTNCILTDSMYDPGLNKIKRYTIEHSFCSDIFSKLGVTEFNTTPDTGARWILLGRSLDGTLSVRR